jgi:ribosomal protein S25
VEQEQQYRQLFVETKTLQGRSPAVAVMLIQKKLKIGRSHAYNILHHLERRGWIVIMPTTISYPKPKDGDHQ